MAVYGPLAPDHRLREGVPNLCRLTGVAQAQTVEVFGGSQKTTLDVMFFKFFLLPKTLKTEAEGKAEAMAEVPRKPITRYLLHFWI